MLPGKIETVGDLTEKEIIRAERNSGVVSSKVREIQVSSDISLSFTSFMCLNGRFGPA